MDNLVATGVDIFGQRLNVRILSEFGSAEDRQQQSLDLPVKAIRKAQQLINVCRAERGVLRILRANGEIRGDLDDCCGTHSCGGPLFPVILCHWVWIFSTSERSSYSLWLPLSFLVIYIPRLSSSIPGNAKLGRKLRRSRVENIISTIIEE